MASLEGSNGRISSFRTISCAVLLSIYAPSMIPRQRSRLRRRSCLSKSAQTEAAHFAILIVKRAGGIAGTAISR
jgi:hypothetical protein